MVVAGRWCGCVPLFTRLLNAPPRSTAVEARPSRTPARPTTRQVMDATGGRSNRPPQPVCENPRCTNETGSRPLTVHRGKAVCLGGC